MHTLITSEIVVKFSLTNSTPYWESVSIEFSLTANFSTSLSNHSVCCEGEESGNTNSGSAFAVLRRHSTNSNNTRVRCCTGPGGGFFDFEHVHIIVCRDG